MKDKTKLKMRKKKIDKINKNHPSKIRASGTIIAVAKIFR